MDLRYSLVTIQKRFQTYAFDLSRLTLRSKKWGELFKSSAIKLVCDCFAFANKNILSAKKRCEILGSSLVICKGSKFQP